MKKMTDAEKLAAIVASDELFENYIAYNNAIDSAKSRWGLTEEQAVGVVTDLWNWDLVNSKIRE